MAYAATAEVSLPPMTAPPAVLAVQRALVWLVGASGAIVFIEPSPYEIATLLATVFFFATGSLRMRLVLIPLLATLVLLNLGYTISAIGVYDQNYGIPDRPSVATWIATSWYLSLIHI